MFGYDGSMSETKTCVGCGDKPVSAFGRRMKSKDGLNRRCRSCWNSYLAERRRRSPEATHKQRAWSSAQRKKVSELHRGLKTGKQCLDCRVAYPYYVLEFDHRQGTKKIGCISRLAGDGRISVLLTEIKKCDLVCANCHAERSHRRRQKEADKPVSVV